MRRPIILISELSHTFEAIKPILGEHKYIAFISTAAEVEKTTDWFQNDRKLLESLKNVKILDYTITGKNAAQIHDDLSEVDALYIVGGNVFYLLYQAQQNGFLDFVRKFVASGGLYIGQSAGAILAGPSTYPAYRADKITEAPKLEDYDGLGIVDFVTLPHWGSPEKRSLYFNERFQYIYNENYKILPLTDFQYATVVDDAVRLFDGRNNSL